MRRGPPAARTSLRRRRGLQPRRAPPSVSPRAHRRRRPPPTGPTRLPDATHALADHGRPAGCRPSGSAHRGAVCHRDGGTRSARRRERAGTAGQPAAAPAAPASGEIIEIRARPAALWQRITAFIVDGALIGGVLALYVGLAAALIAPHGASSTQLTGIDGVMARVHQLNAVLAPCVALALVLGLVDAGAFALLWNGRTPGRRLLGIRLVDRTGLAPTPGRAITRSALAAFLRPSSWPDLARPLRPTGADPSRQADPDLRRPSRLTRRALEWRLAHDRTAGRAPRHPRAVEPGTGGRRPALAGPRRRRDGHASPRDGRAGGSKNLVTALGEVSGLQPIYLADYVPNPAMASALPREDADRLNIAPLSVEDGMLHVAVAHPVPMRGLEDPGPEAGPLGGALGVHRRAGARLALEGSTAHRFPRGTPPSSEPWARRSRSGWPRRWRNRRRKPSRTSLCRWSTLAPPPDRPRRDRRPGSFPPPRRSRPARSSRRSRREWPRPSPSFPPGNPSLPPAATRWWTGRCQRPAPRSGPSPEIARG